MVIILNSLIPEIMDFLESIISLKNRLMTSHLIEGTLDGFSRLSKINLNMIRLMIIKNIECLFFLSSLVLGKNLQVGSALNPYLSS